MEQHECIVSPVCRSGLGLTLPGSLFWFHGLKARCQLAGSHEDALGDPPPRSLRLVGVEVLCAPCPSPGLLLSLRDTACSGPSIFKASRAGGALGVPQLLLTLCLICPQKLVWSDRPL